MMETLILKTSKELVLFKTTFKKIREKNDLEIQVMIFITTPFFDKNDIFFPEPYDS